MLHFITCPLHSCDSVVATTYMYIHTYIHVHVHDIVYNTFLRTDVVGNLTPFGIVVIEHQLTISSILFDFVIT